MNKNFENPEDLIADEEFLVWYFDRTSNEAKNWETKLATSTHLQTLNTEAEIIMKHLHFEEKGIPANQIGDAYRKLKEKIEEGEMEKKSPVVKMPATRNRWWMAAASVIILVIAGFFVLNIF